MVKIWNVTIPELTGRLQRLAYVYLPESYTMHPDQRYPVLYMFDGHNVFFDSHATYGKSWGMKEYMDLTDTQIIIAAVECNHSPNNGRLSEYSPFSFSDPEYGPIPGWGDIYMHWLIDEFKPYIDKRYRTLPDRNNTMIAGSSMGGLMSLYAAMEFNDTFGKAACLSPSIGFSPREVRKMIDEADPDPDTVLYMDCGSKELDYHGRSRELYSDITGRLIKKGINVVSRIIPGGEHCEASWEKQIPFFMNTLLYQ